MSYEKHTWETGETITAEKLNNLENGVASGGDGSSDIFMFTVSIDPEIKDPSLPSYIADKTFEEVVQAYQNEKYIVCICPVPEDPNSTVYAPLIETLSYQGDITTFYFSPGSLIGYTDDPTILQITNNIVFYDQNGHVYFSQNESYVSIVDYDASTGGGK